MQLLVFQAALFITLLAVASAIDIRRRIIPNSICAGIALAGLICFSPADLFGVLAALPLLTAALYKRGSIGGGDIKLTAACGIVLGFSDGITGLCLGLAAMLFFHAGSRIARRLKQDGKTEKTKSLPMAPFLSIGFIAIYILRIAGL
ncbi:A24 family peptidase [Ruminococcaceae bacterium OttesenSCG-928-D13]|nr:A24 family peptidase [Ruminococcaceae bacterium OttesenSCG-928-D13]